MRIALFHNYMDNIGGAEKVTLTLAKELNADIYTTVFDRAKIRKLGFSSDNIYSIGWVPKNAPFRQEITYWRFRLFEPKKKYDYYIISGDWAMSGCVKNKPNAWYVHSPTRELWDLRKHVRQSIRSWYGKIIFDAWSFFHRVLNRLDVSHVQHIICNSLNVKKRVRKYLNKNSQVIHPPVQTKEFYNQKSQKYWLSVNRLYIHKRIEVQLEAFSKMPDKKLIIVGCYEDSQHFTNYAKKMKERAPSNVEFLHWVEDQELKNLYAQCEGVISTSLDEDFGLTSIEAQASGKPMIAPKKGGYIETIIHNETGYLLEKVDSNALINAIKHVETWDNRSQKCINRAKMFDTNIFVKKIKEALLL